MRNFAVFGVGLPVLMLSGVIASGAVSGFEFYDGSTKQVAQVVEAKSVLIDAPAFVSAGLFTTPVEEYQTEDNMIVAQAAGIGQTAPFDQIPQTEELVLQDNDSDRDGSDALVVSVTPIIVAAEPPATLPTVKRSAPVKQVTARTRSLSPTTGTTKPAKFKMPWQTGVFQ